MMTILKIKVDCGRCKKSVEKTQARLVDTPKGSKRYECLSCFKKNRAILLGLEQEEPKFKQDMFCGRCKYHFKSKNVVCPYCNDSDYIVRGDISVGDLL